MHIFLGSFFKVLYVIGFVNVCEQYCVCVYIDLVAMLMDPISFANRALQDMAEGLVRGQQC